MKARRIALFLLLILVVVGVGVAAASGAEGHAESAWTEVKLAGRVINSLILFALLFYFVKPPLVAFFSERKNQIQRDLEEARVGRERAEQLIKEYETKIAGMEQQLQSMREELARTSEMESEKVVAKANEMGEKLIAAAKVTAEQEVRKARIALKNEAVELAVGLAETLIRERINDGDRARIVEDYLAKVGGMK